MYEHAVTTVRCCLCAISQSCCQLWKRVLQHEQPCSANLLTDIRNYLHTFVCAVYTSRGYYSRAASIQGSMVITVLTRHYAPFVYKPPLTICMNLLLRYIYLQFMPPTASATPTNEKKVRTHHTTLYMKSSFLLASDTPTKRLATRRQARI